MSAFPPIPLARQAKRNTSLEEALSLVVRHAEPEPDLLQEMNALKPSRPGDEHRWVLGGELVRLMVKDGYEIRIRFKCERCRGRLHIVRKVTELDVVSRMTPGNKALLAFLVGQIQEFRWSVREWVNSDEGRLSGGCLDMKDLDAVREVMDS